MKYMLYCVCDSIDSKNVCERQLIILIVFNWNDQLKISRQWNSFREKNSV